MLELPREIYERQHNGVGASEESAQEDTEEQDSTEENHDSLTNKSDEMEKKRQAFSKFFTPK